MTDIGSIAKAINAQAVILEKSGTDEIITVHNIVYSKIHPIHRKNTRAGPLDNYSWSIIELVFECLVTKDMADDFDTLNTLNSRSALPTESFTLTGLNLTNTSGDDDVVSFNATVPDFTRTAGSEGEYTARIKLRAIETNPT